LTPTIPPEGSLTGDDPELVKERRASTPASGGLSSTGRSNLVAEARSSPFLAPLHFAILRVTRNKIIYVNSEEGADISP